MSRYVLHLCAALVALFVVMTSAGVPEGAASWTAAAAQGAAVSSGVEGGDDGGVAFRCESAGECGLGNVPASGESGSELPEGEDSESDRELEDAPDWLLASPFAIKARSLVFETEPGELSNQYLGLEPTVSVFRPPEV